MMKKSEKEMKHRNLSEALHWTGMKPTRLSVSLSVGTNKYI